MRIDGKHQYKKGSVTIEAALLFPMLLSVILMVLYLGFYRYNQTICTYAAYQAGSKCASGQMETAEELRPWLVQHTIALSQISVQEHEENGRITVLVSGQMQIPFVGWKMSVREEQWAYRSDPVTLIRWCRVLLQRD